MICTLPCNSRQYTMLQMIQISYILAKVRKRLNKDLVLLYDWLCANRLSLNAGKTEFIVFRPPGHKSTDRVTLKLHHTKLFESSKIKYLGLILDNKLDWKAHIAELSKKLSRAIGLLYKIRNFCPLSVLRSLYFSIFNSHLSYVWPCRLGQCKSVTH